jgi:hypothetical protein
VFDKLSGKTQQYSVEVLETEIKSFGDEFPDLVPSFNSRDHLTHEHRPSNTRFYDVSGIQAYIGVALGRLEVEIEQVNDTPVTEYRDFAFANNAELRKILERDYHEIQRAYISECWKSVINLCGGVIETIPTDLPTRELFEGQRVSAAPGQNNGDFSKWSLSILIDVAVEMGLVTGGVEKLSRFLREYGNLVHRGKEIRNTLSFDAAEARIAVRVVNMVHRDSRKQVPNNAMERDTRVGRATT